MKQFGLVGQGKLSLMHEYKRKIIVLAESNLFTSDAFRVCLMTLNIYKSFSTKLP